MWSGNHLPAFNSKRRLKKIIVRIIITIIIKVWSVGKGTELPVVKGKIENRRHEIYNFWI